MLGQPPIYWIIALVAFVLCCAPYACSRWEARQDRRDREAWGKVPGAR